MSGQMSIHDCQARAKKEGFDSAEFDLCGVGGRKHAKWLDAYFGLFILDGADGFNSVSDIAGLPVWCENFEANGVGA